MSEIDLMAAGLRSVTKAYKGEIAVDKVSLDVARGSFVTLLGPSGCGKSTTLNMIAGFITPDSGEILLEGRNVNNVPPHQRDTSMVFQQYALFPHMTVLENVGYGLRMRKVDRRESRQRSLAALEAAGIGHAAHRAVSELSGGQQQRVALARSLVLEPSVLLMDEPLSALDLKLREQMRAEIRRIQKNSGQTVVYVTHDQGEALAISDVVVVMNGGRIEQAGSPAEVYQKPRTEFVASFIGTSNRLPGRATGDAAIGDVLSIDCRIGRLQGVAGAPIRSGDRVVVVVRPESCHVVTVPTEGPKLEPVLAAKLLDIEYLGASRRYVCELADGTEFVVDQSTREPVVTNAQGVIVHTDALVLPSGSEEEPDGDRD